MSEHQGNGRVDDAQTVVDAAPALAAMRVEVDNPHLFRGLGPLAVGIVLFILMVVLAPSVAPEQVVERPKGESTSESDGGIVTTSSTAVTTTTAAPAAAP